jgi:hypothetical protein
MRFAMLAITIGMLMAQAQTLDDEAAAAGLRKPSSADTTGQLVLEFGAALDQALRAHYPVWVCDDCQFNSDPKFGVIVSLSQIAEIQRQSKVSQFPQVLFWLMGHEMAHQAQFQTYGKDLWTLPSDQKQVYEAQADILAGKFLLERLPVNANAAENLAIGETLRVAYDLGTERYLPADHPSHEARLTATRLGMAAGMQTKLAAQTDSQMQASAMLLAQKIDFRYGEDVLGWSLRVARRATNQRSPDILDLVLTKKQFFFDRDPSHPVVSYWLTYQNRGTRMLNVDLEALCAAVPRDDPEDTLRWQRTNSLNYQVPIPAGSSFTFQGAMEWYGDDAMYPRMVSAPAAQALIHVEAVGGAATPTDRAGTLNRSLAAGSPVVPSLSSVALMKNALIDIWAQKGNGFRALRSGPGELVTDFVRYASRVSFPGAIRTDVQIPEPGNDDRPSVAASLARAHEEQDSIAVFDKSLTLVRAGLPSGKWTEDKGDGEITFASEGRSLRVRRWKSKATGIWRVDAEIE